MVPLQVISKSFKVEIVSGSKVQRQIFNVPFSKLLAPVKYGIPAHSELYLLGVKSVPETSFIIDPNLTHSQLSGMSKGSSSSIHFGSEFPIFS